MSAYFAPPQQSDDLSRAVLRSIQADHFGRDDDPHADDESAYALEQVALAARALTVAVDALTEDRQPVGWPHPLGQAGARAESWTHPDGTAYDLRLKYVGADDDEWMHAGFDLDGDPIMKLVYPGGGRCLTGLPELHAEGGSLPAKECGEHIGPGKFCASLPEPGTENCPAHGGGQIPR